MKGRAEPQPSNGPERAQARLALLEEKSVLVSKISERDQIMSSELFPDMDEKRRQVLSAQLEVAVAAAVVPVKSGEPSWEPPSADIGRQGTHLSV